MKTNTSPIVNLENFKTVVLLKKLKEEDPSWLPEDELFYQKMEKNIMFAIESKISAAKSATIIPKIDMLPLAMSRRNTSTITK